MGRISMSVRAATSIGRHRGDRLITDFAATGPVSAIAGKVERGDSRSRSRLWLLALALASSVSVSAQAAPPYGTSVCAADRVPNLNCTANDVEVARVTVLNNVTTCVAGQPVSLDLRAFLHVNAQDRHDLGIFLAKDGRSPIIPSSATGGSASCAVFGLPQSPAPYANLDGNACGDLDRDGLPQGTEVPLDLGLVTVTCKADPNGYLDIPTVITWATGGTPTSCQAPMAAWVEPSSPSKCESGIAARIEVQVLGSIVVTKQTDPDAATGSFLYTATGPGVSPTSFSLSDGQSTQPPLTTGPLGLTPQTYTITEQQLAGWTPGAELVCVDVDGDIPGPDRVTVDNPNRTVTAYMSASFSQVFCTFTNRKQSSITVNKTTVGGDGTFPFSGSSGIAPFSIATNGGASQRVISGLAAGTYTVTEVVPAGWNLTALTCTDPSGDSTIDLATGTATINLASGESVVCNYTDTKRGSITVVKSVIGGNGSFDFNGPPSPASPSGTFQITTSSGTGQVVLTDLAPGTYNVTESIPAGWDLTNIGCIDPSGGTSTSASTAIVALAAGENVTCTFTDTKRGSIIVQKVTQGPDGTFNFTGHRISGSLRPAAMARTPKPTHRWRQEIHDHGDCACRWSLLRAFLLDGSATDLGAATA